MDCRGGRTPVVPTMGQVHIHKPSLPGARNFTGNMLRGLEAVTGDVLVIVEDDDWYSQSHIAHLARLLERHGVAIAGDPCQRYYHLPSRRWRTFQNKGASLCQTGLRLDGFPWLRRAIEEAGRAGRYGVDFSLWQQAPPYMQALDRSDTVVGVKGLPGRPGLGIGHRPSGPSWQRDRTGAMFRAWLKSDADVYLTLGRSREAVAV
jgi:hypothetical protein